MTRVFHLFNNHLFTLYLLLWLQEQPNENLDDDEDKKNPAYIPRKGAFFEHDMRMDPDADERNLPGGGRG